MNKKLIESKKNNPLTMELYPKVAQKIDLIRTKIRDLNQMKRKKK